MNLPIHFVHTAAKINGLVWGSDSGDSTAIANTYPPSPTPTAKRVYLRGYTIVSDTDAGQCKIGVYNLTTDVFTAKLTVLATKVAGGGIAHPEVIANGVLLELYDAANPTHSIVPCVQLTTGASLILAGDLQLEEPGESGEDLQVRLRAATTLYALEEGTTVVNELEEDNATPVREEN